MGGHEQLMAFLIMLHDQSAAPKDFSLSPNEATWNQMVSIDGFAVPIDVKDRNRTVC